jgi:Streptomyces sporulation and cell division protein, SsgA
LGGVEVSRPEVQRQVATRLIGEGVSAPLDLTLQYFMRDDPYAVKLRFASDGVVVEWVVSRALLQDGTGRPVGEGDFRIGPSGRLGWLRATLKSPDGVATIELDRQGLVAFLDATTRLVPFGGEVQDIDSIISRIFAGESA